MSENKNWRGKLLLEEKRGRDTHYPPGTYHPLGREAGTLHPSEQSWDRMGASVFLSAKIISAL